MVKKINITRIEVGKNNLVEERSFTSTVHRKSYSNKRGSNCIFVHSAGRDYSLTTMTPSFSGFPRFCFVRRFWNQTFTYNTKSMLIFFIIWVCFLSVELFYIAKKQNRFLTNKNYFNYNMLIPYFFSNRFVGQK